MIHMLREIIRVGRKKKGKERNGRRREGKRGRRG
jgi:hypothetical protein